MKNSVPSFFVVFPCFFFSHLSAGSQGTYDQAVGPITIVFFAIVVCTCGYRRQRGSPSLSAEDREGAAQAQLTRPRDVLNVRVVDWFSHRGVLFTRLVPLGAFASRVAFSVHTSSFTFLAGARSTRCPSSLAVVRDIF